MKNISEWIDNRWKLLSPRVRSILVTSLTLSVYLLYGGCGGRAIDPVGAVAGVAAVAAATAAYTCTENKDGSLTISKTEGGVATKTTYAPGEDVPDDILEEIEATDGTTGAADYDAYVIDILKGTPLPDTTSLTQAQQNLRTIAIHNAALA